MLGEGMNRYKCLEMEQPRPTTAQLWPLVSESLRHTTQHESVAADLRLLPVTLQMSSTPVAESCMLQHKGEIKEYGAEGGGR
jgi:hypothetical protein